MYISTTTFATSAFASANLTAASLTATSINPNHMHIRISTIILQLHKIYR